MFNNKYVVIDLETTGNNPKKGDKIIQFAAVVIENGRITDSFSSLVNPQKPIPAFIEELTGLDDEMVKDAPLFNEIAAKVISLLDGAYFVAHNILFDLSFLQEELIQAGYEGFYGSVLDTVEMARILFPTADGYKLSDLAAKEDLHHDRPHQADSDAQVTAELFLILLKNLAALPMITLRQLSQLAGGLKSDLQQLIDEMINEKNQTNEIVPASIEIYNTLALKQHLKTITHSHQERSSYPDSEQEKIAVVSQGFSVFEKRDGQFQMMDGVYQSFKNEQHALIEAGTGVGKSLGYLLPAAYFAKEKSLPVVVSTHTTQLQEQILYKEIPQLEKMLPFSLKSVLLKGRSHYICLDKFSRTLIEENDNYDTTLTKMQILVWLTDTETGDRDELNLSSGGNIFWNKIKSEQTIFTRNSLWKERDFYLRAKTEAVKADIIITNHSLFLSDLKAESSILPDFHFAIIDEGHHFEKVASQFFGHSLDYLTTRLLLAQFGQYDQKLLFYELEKMLRLNNGNNEDLIQAAKLNQLVVDLNYEMDEFFKLTALFAKAKSAARNGINRVKVRFTRGDKRKDSTALVHSAERFAFLLKDFQSAISNRIERITNHKELLSGQQKGKLEDIITFINDLEVLRESVHECFLKEEKDVKWIEIDFRSQQNVTTFFSQPAFVAASLRESLFNVKKGVVLTSATLTVNNCSFDFVMKELGLDPVSTLTMNIPSPFAYSHQVQLLIPEDLPEIKTVTLDEYVIAITEHIITIAEATKGRMLILFTAYDMLKKTYDLIKESGFLNDYVMIAQGITSGSRTRLTRNFQRYEKAILLGTSSFWEGVDIPGEDLSCLVIVRLPFSPPDEPLTEAKCQIINQRGGNAFMEYSLPEAILRFKQGFGRLIRTENDRGIIFVFDKRIITTRYGRSFLKSIPDVPMKKGNIDDLVEIINSWL